jgi:hypothetical protein
MLTLSRFLASLAVVTACAVLLAPSAGAGGRRSGGCGACDTPVATGNRTAPVHTQTAASAGSRTGDLVAIGLALGAGLAAALAVGARARRRA